MSRIKEVLDTLERLREENPEGISAIDVAQILDIDRSNISRYLNILYRDGKVEKLEGRPVLYRTIDIEKDTFKERNTPISKNKNSLDKMVGANQSLAISIDKAKAAIMYPPKGLHTLILGETGVGKSMFAELMYQFSIETNILGKDAPFIRFNCADYASNQNLLTAQIFGVKKGAYTGATKDREGLLKKADGGFIFLDEIHRLSPQGQEMLFTYIDNGFFRPLGETENLSYVDVRIIAATTEDPKSNLLKTFTRRIPMVITLPPIRDRGLSERYDFIETFIKEESHRLGKSIYINKNAIISYLLYDCPNNIGQLKSDIQLACAKAFLNYKSQNNNYILITQCDLPNHVKKGIMNINQYRNEVEQLLNFNYDILKFNQSEKPPLLMEIDKYTTEDFYNSIEEKLKSLKNMGISEQDINEIINIDIETHFKEYIGSISRHFHKEEISNIVDNKILEVVEEILLLGEKKLNKHFSEKVYFALSFHLERSINRIKNGEKIYNPKLNFIRINYEEEFLFAMKITRIIDERFGIETPVDEIGYLAMFFATDSYKFDKVEVPKVGILVIMHGKTTASSMVEVANSLIGTDHAIALDMPLNMKPETMYSIAKRKVEEINKGEGVIILVDMGSLTTFGDMIWEETGIEVRTIEMVSTSMVLEVLRKSIVGYSIDEIMEAFKNKHVYKYRSNVLEEGNNIKDIIVTACFTGDGASKKIANIIGKEISNKNIDIFTINIIDENNLENRLYKLKDKYNILAIISTISLDISWAPVFLAVDIFTNEGIDKLNNVFEENEMCLKISQSLTEHLPNIKDKKIVKEIRYILYEVEYKLGLKVSIDVRMGIMLHICFLIDNLIKGVIPRKFNDLEEYKKTYKKEMKILREIFSPIENKYEIVIGENEIGYILKTFLSNQISVY
ncbi:MAG: sigma 54-interacting transcriptional regulator [Clostridiaceae bacterium]|nr:sigma 54-interacting transcriptional regulator [Clostridiaceae bacterium]MBW4859290.1 sigma 54-interacting transcriptional regulator [Clostridiaceae bacterium]MBW4868747.1 sigma 54-interacting transcriptional regulator [Clostridiaceae bacterium]